MKLEPTISDPEVLAAYQVHERKEMVSTGKVAAALVVFLMPAGMLLDKFVYPDKLGLFLGLRLLCSLLAGGLWYLHFTEWGQRNIRGISVPIPLLPSFFIVVMIAATDGAISSYYAGLNLVLLAISVAVRWSVADTLRIVLGTFFMYLAGCIINGLSRPEIPIFINNCYFLSVTGLIVVIGNYLFNRLRLREFTLRYELDRNRQKLEENNQKLMELDQAKSRFFANISHELRTPLTLLLAPLETIIHRFSRSFDEDTRNLLTTMQANGMRLLKLINDLLDLVRLESGRLQLRKEAVDMQDFSKGLASAVRQVAEDKRIRLVTHVDSELGAVLADRDKLEKIILNLLFNALKFTPSGGRVELRAEKRDDRFVLIVADTGMGISKKNLENVFSRFWQADDSSRRKYQGVGIGLALVKELTELHGGVAEVASAEGQGTTFTITLPYEKAEASNVTEPAPATSPAAPEPSAVSASTPASTASEEWLTGLYRRAELFPAMSAVKEAMRPEMAAGASRLPKLLIADDEPDMLRFLKSQLMSHYNVLEAVDGQQAIEKAAQFLPEIILLDMMMPEKDGLQACRELRQRSTTASIPIILLTARADEETKLAALSAGASDFLPKPFSTTELHVRVKNLVDSYQYQRKLSKQNQVLEQTIDQLKETETQLVQTEKLASLGRMSAGIIHEINNPLNFATTGLYTLRNKSKYIPAEQKEEYDEVLKDVEDGIKRVKTIVSDLRSFSHNENEIIQDVPLDEVVTSSLRFVSHDRRDKVAMEEKLQANILVPGNKNKLIQVLVNLLQNAIDALETKTFPEGEKPSIRIETRTTNSLAELVVRDNGPGIDPANLDKIFDPFFTTKDVGEGMGLGLSICYRIIQEHGGRIRVNSEPGRFCEFTLELPLERNEHHDSTASDDASEYAATV